MKFYDKYFASNYDELINYYPRFYREVFEMVEILKTYGRIADEMEGNIERAFLNGFIDYADEETIAKLEKFLHIGLNKRCTLEERRRLVKSYFIGFGKISASLICQMMEAYTNASVNCRLEPFDAEGNHALYITMQQGAESVLYLSVIRQLISLKIPAHIKYIFAIEVMLDNRNLEQMVLQKLLLHMRAHFWDCKIFDGFCHFDGSVSFNQKRSYSLAIGIKNRSRIFTKNVAALPILGIIAKTKIDERAGIGVRYRFAADFWNTFYFDGTWKFDGSKLFNAFRRRMEVKCNMHMKVDANTDYIGDVIVIVKRNPHFLDGSCKFDGSVMANAVYREEVIE